MAAPGGNPGPAGYGVSIQGPDGAPLDELHGGLGIATNNVAEYNGLLAALRWATGRGNAHDPHPRRLRLLVNQMRGEYRVKNEGLKPLFLQACALIRGIGDVTFEHVRRELNTDADPPLQPGDGRSRGSAEDRRLMPQARFLQLADANPPSPGARPCSSSCG